MTLTAFALGVLVGAPLGPLDAFVVYRARLRHLPPFERRARRLECGARRVEKKAMRALASESVYQSEELAPRYLSAARALRHAAHRSRMGELD